MKKHFAKAVMILGLALTVIGCKEPKENWNTLYSFQAKDIAGKYAFSGEADAFDGLTENSYSHLCTDAEIEITGDTLSAILVSARFTDHGLWRTFSGPSSLTPNDYFIDMTSSGYKFIAHVLADKEGGIRLEGRVAHDQTVDTLWSTVNYYFDVIKIKNNEQ